MVGWAPCLRGKGACSPSQCLCTQFCEAVCLNRTFTIVIEDTASRRVSPPALCSHEKDRCSLMTVILDRWGHLPELKEES